MNTESETKRTEVSKETKEVEDLMLRMATEQKQADEQQRHIEAERIKIMADKAHTEKLAEDAENELRKALPAL